jgi:CheY-like chemotaxis protein
LYLGQFSKAGKMRPLLGARAGHPRQSYWPTERNQTAHPMSVLLVEDHQVSREILARFLEHWGFDVVTAESLQKGLGALEEMRFDAIISDIALPDGSGYALISDAKQRDKDVVGIALSGYASPGDVNIGRLAGFDYHLTKPCDCERLRSILAGAVDPQG